MLVLYPCDDMNPGPEFCTSLSFVARKAFNHLGVYNRSGFREAPLEGLGWLGAMYLPIARA